MIDRAHPQTVDRPSAPSTAIDSPIRRRTVRYLSERSSAATLDELSEALAAKDDERRTGRSSPSRLRIRLHHADLPKLEAAGLLEYDRERRIVRLSSAAGQNGGHGRSNRRYRLRRGSGAEK